MRNSRYHNSPNHSPTLLTPFPVWRNLHHEARRSISLITTTREAQRLLDYETKGLYELRPSKVFFNTSGFAKVVVGVYERGDIPDKRASLDAKEYKREKVNHTLD